MAVDYVMPKLAMAMNEGTVIEWLIATGEKVQRGQSVATVETEKVAYDLESPCDGYLHITVPEGQTVPVETQIGIFADSEGELEAISGGESVSGTSAGGESTATESAPLDAEPIDVSSQQTKPDVPVPSAGERIKSSPLARKLANDAQLDLKLVSGSGPGGRIVKRDIQAALDTAATGRSAVSAGNFSDAVTADGEKTEIARIPMAGMRKVISDRMLEGMQSSAQLSSAWDSDISDLIAMREKFVVREQELGTRVSMNAFIIKAIVAAIKEVPIANSCLEGDEIVIYDTISIGIAIAMPGTTQYDSGLMVGVLHDVGRMGLVEIDREMKVLIERVRSGKAANADLTGSTITLSSTAGIAPPGMKTTPILNSPNATLIGPSTPIEKPVARNGEVVVRTMMPVAVTFNHCVYDGEPAARFMKALHNYLENPELMLA